MAAGETLATALVGIALVEGDFVARLVTAVERGAVAGNKAAVITPTVNTAGVFGPKFKRSAVAGGALLGNILGESMGSSLSVAASAAAGVGLSVVGLAAVKFLGDSGKAAIDLREQITANQQIFRQAGGEITAFAVQAASAFGVTRQQVLRATADFGNLFTSLGVGRGNAASISELIVRLSADVASFRNFEVPDIFEKFRSGLVGLPKSLREVGIFLTESNTKAAALALGFHAVGGNFTDAEKILARLKVSLEQSTNAQGDQARTFFNTANVVRRSTASFNELKLGVGQLIEPVIKLAAVVAGVLSSGLTGIVQLAGKVSQGLGIVAAGVVKVVGLIPGASAVGRFLVRTLTDSSGGFAVAAQNALSYANAQQLLANASRGLIVAQKDLAAATIVVDKVQAKATSALFASVDAVLGAQRADLDVRQARLGVAQAQQRLNEVRNSGTKTAEAIAKAERGVRDANESLAVSTQTVLDIEARLADARRGATLAETARADLKVRGARLDVLEATNSLTQAERLFNRVRNSRNTLLVKDAELAYERAKIGSESSTLDLTDAEMDQNKVREKGSERDPEIIQLQKDLAGAQTGVAKATEAVRDAEKAVRDARAGDVGHANDIAAATLGVEAANLGLGQALIKLPEAQAKAQIALDTLKASLEKNAGFASILYGLLSSSPNAGPLFELLDALGVHLGNFVIKVSDAKKALSELSQPLGPAGGTAGAQYLIYLSNLAAHEAIPKNLSTTGQLGPNLNPSGSRGSLGEPRAHGGPVQKGRAYIVGEDGPELFVPDRNGGIRSNNSGGDTWNIYPSQGMSEYELARQAARESAWQRKAGG